MICRERIIHYLLDIISVPRGPLLSRAENHWGKFFQAALSIRVFHPAAAWIPDLWDDVLPESIYNDLHDEILSNKARNSALSIQIAKLSKLFADNNIGYFLNILT